MPRRRRSSVRSSGKSSAGKSSGKPLKARRRRGSEEEGRGSISSKVSSVGSVDTPVEAEVTGGGGGGDGSTMEEETTSSVLSTDTGVTEVIDAVEGVGGRKAAAVVEEGTRRGAEGKEGAGGSGVGNGVEDDCSPAEERGAELDMFLGAFYYSG